MPTGGEPLASSIQGFTSPRVTADTPLGTYLVHFCKGMHMLARVSTVTLAHTRLCVQSGVRKGMHICACTRMHTGHELTWDTDTSPRTPVGGGGVQSKYQMGITSMSLRSRL